METLYKLMSAKNETLGPTIWGDGVSHGPLSGEGNLCGPGWFHAYTHPLLAVLFDPVHGQFGPNAILRRAEGIVCKTDHGTKVGCQTITTFEQIPLPVISTTRRVAFGILATLALDQPDIYREWARRWLDGTDRSETGAMSTKTWIWVSPPLHAALLARVATAKAAAWGATGMTGETELAAADSAETAAYCKPIDLIAIANLACLSPEEKWYVGR